jgi:transcriptional regulator with XRE-family HTH domain
VPIRTNAIEDASRRAGRQLDDAVNELRNARLAAGLSQSSVARALGCSPQLISLLEGRSVEPGPIQLARWGAALGIDLPIRTFPGGSPLRDAGQLRLLLRFRASVGELWTWHTEVAVSTDPRDRRAIDAVLSRPPCRIGVEAIVRLTDAQAQVRALLLKQAASGVDRVVVVLADSRHNRIALRDAAPTLEPAFPLSPRETMRALRAGSVPPANGIVLM